LLKNQADLTDEQAVTLRKLKRKGGELWRAYGLKEALRAVFAGDLDETDVAILADRFCSKAQRSGLKPFVTLAGFQPGEIDTVTLIPETATVTGPIQPVTVKTARSRLVAR
jgi:Transposase